MQNTVVPNPAAPQTAQQTALFTGPEPDPREIALATVGVESAGESIAATAQFLDLDRIFHPAPGQSFAEHRELMRLGAPALSPTAVDEQVGSVPVRRLVPASGPSRGLYLHLHGGGWALGSHRTGDGRLQQLADATGLTVVSVGYRLAPEHPYPAALDDVLVVARALAPAAEVAMIGGESAGAHLAVLALQRLAAAGEFPFAGALLTYGCYDMAGSPESTSPGVGRDLWLPDVPAAARRDPAYSPLFGSVRGLPPARFVVGTRDDLLEDTLQMAARWAQVAPTEVEIVCGAAHAFTLLDIPAARASIAADHDYLNRLLATE